MLEDEIYRALGARIGLRRNELGLSQAELALQVGMSRGSVANIEAGRQRLPLHQLYRFLEALRLSDVSALLPAPPQVTAAGGDALSLDMRKATKDLSASAKAQVEALYEEFGR